MAEGNNNNALYFIVGAVVVVVALLFFFMSGGDMDTATDTTAPAGADTTVNVDSAPDAAEPADAAPADGGAEPTSN